MSVQQQHQHHQLIFPEAKVYPWEIPREYTNDPSRWLEDTRYITLNTTSITKYLHFYDSDSNVRIASHICNTSLYAGGIVAEKDGEEMKADAKQWLSETYELLGKSMDRCKDALGFTLVTSVEHSRYYKTPVVLDLEQCVIRYRLDSRNIPHVVVFEHVSGADNIIDMTKGGNANQSQQGGGNNRDPYQFNVQGRTLRYIPDVTCFYDLPPDRHGNIRSKISVLAVDFEVDMEMTYCTLMANRQRAQPPIMVQQIPSRTDNQSVTNAINPTSMMYGDGQAPHAPTEAQQQNMETQAKRQSDYLRLVNYMGFENFLQADAQSKVKTSHEDEFTPYRLPDCTEYVKVTLPESPGELLIKHHIWRQEKTYNSFGIPLGMISQTSSISSNTSMNENCYVVFQNTQKAKKQQLINYFTEIYKQSYTVHHIMHRLANEPDLKVDDIDMNDIGVTISMPGLPPVELLHVLYLAGLLNVHAYCKILSAIHCMAIENFNTTPTIDVKMLNGIKPETASSSSSSSSSK